MDSLEDSVKHHFRKDFPFPQDGRALEVGDIPNQQGVGGMPFP